MRHPDQGQGYDPVEDTKTMLKVVIFVIHAGASLHELVWRVPGYCGRRYFGMQTLVAYVFAIPVAGHACPPRYGEAWLLRSWSFLFTLWIVHRLASVISKLQIHSNDVGRSWLSLLFGIPNRTAQTTGELVGSIVLGVLLGGLCETLALVCFAGGLLNVFHIALIGARYTRIAENVRDQRLEGMEIADRIRELDR